MRVVKLKCALEVSKKGMKTDKEADFSKELAEIKKILEKQ